MMEKLPGTSCQNDASSFKFDTEIGKIYNIYISTRNVRQYYGLNTIQNKKGHANNNNYYNNHQITLAL